MMLIKSLSCISCSSKYHFFSLFIKFETNTVYTVSPKCIHLNRLSVSILLSNNPLILRKEIPSVHPILPLNYCHCFKTNTSLIINLVQIHLVKHSKGRIEATHQNEIKDFRRERKQFKSRIRETMLILGKYIFTYLGPFVIPSAIDVNFG